MLSEMHNLSKGREIPERTEYRIQRKKYKRRKTHCNRIERIICKSGLTLKRFFNTSGLKYKELNLKEKLPEMSEDEQLELLSTDGMLVKRPLLVADDFVLVGFKEKEWIEKL